MKTTALALIETAKPLELFTNNGLDPIIAAIEKEVKAEVLDISTAEGRKRIASLAHKVAKSKTAIDEAGKKLTEDWKRQSKAVDAERRRAWDRLETLQKEIRAPLTEWEEAEKTRIARHEADIAEIVNGGRFTLENWQTLPPQAMADRLRETEALTTWTWQEFATRAKQAIEEAAKTIRMAMEKRQTYDAEQAELERLRREEAERKQREHEERIAAEAAAKAKAEAGEKARREAEAQAARVKAEQERAEQERQRIERDKQEAEERARKAEEARLAVIAKAEADRKAAAEKAERDRIAAAEKARKDAEAAAQAERDRIERERQAEAAATAKREADKAHKAKINREALQGMFAAISKQHTGDSDEIEKFCKAIIEAIAKGQVSHIKISY